MRIEEVFQNNKDLTKNCRLETEAGRQKAMLSVLTDISETLAMMLDMYGVVHGRTISTKEGPGEQAGNNRPQQ